MPKVVMQIVLDTETNRVQVEGPYHDGILFLGMLEMARLSFTLSKAKTPEKKSEIIVPEVMTPRM